MHYPRCRLALSRLTRSETWLEASQPYFRRFRSGAAQQRPDYRPRDNFYNSPERQPRKFFGNSNTTNRDATRSRFWKPVTPKPLQLNIDTSRPINVEAIIKDRVSGWSKLPHVRRRMQVFGIPSQDLPYLFSAFVRQVHDGMLVDEIEKGQLELERFSISHTEVNHGHRLDAILSQLFFTWASRPNKQEVLKHSVPQSTLDHISRLFNAADFTYPSEAYPLARTMHRKIIMHVGPTNSGKTHVALRALAAARTGVYAGPLRLLAHEIWDRLNKGQIVPLGIEPDADSEPDTTSTVDVLLEEQGSRPTVRKTRNSKYARECNLLTGEEFRIVADNAGLVSCTVEMMSDKTRYDVAVVDEIQMISDPERGYAWTSAVLGLAAKEIHLCGEETAVPIIQSILQETGDELVINRYERLTPLVVQEESLDGDFSQIQKGDCLVTFSRNSIFALKRKVEEHTGMRCAVAYGRLPPEIRAEQAALFNDPNSGYDVMIGSDAIGMGLNLKIKRVVFEALAKFDGTSERSLSVSQIKQIAGRAGRYGLHGEPGGFTTTLNANDLPKLHAALSKPADPLPVALLTPDGGWYDKVSQVLPVGFTLSTVYEALTFIARIRPPYRAMSIRRLNEITEFIERHGHNLSLDDKTLFMNAPISWSDPNSLEFTAQLCRLLHNQFRVGIYEALRATPFVRALQEVEDMMLDDAHSTPASKALPQLESMHKALVLYLWLYGRKKSAYYQYDQALSLKERTEKALEWSLHRMSRKEEETDSERFGLQRDDEDTIEYRRIKTTKTQGDIERKDAVARARVLENIRGQ